MNKKLAQLKDKATQLAKELKRQIENWHRKTQGWLSVRRKPGHDGK
ncbi:MAG: hypothetical protein ACRC8S_15065 [Fimbriiglobus sp.]